MFFVSSRNFRANDSGATVGCSRYHSYTPSSNPMHCVCVHFPHFFLLHRSRSYEMNKCHIWLVDCRHYDGKQSNAPDEIVLLNNNCIAVLYRYDITTTDAMVVDEASVFGLDARETLV